MAEREHVLRIAVTDSGESFDVDLKLEVTGAEELVQVCKILGDMLGNAVAEIHAEELEREADPEANRAYRNSLN